jgi:thioredoxin reductase
VLKPGDSGVPGGDPDSSVFEVAVIGGGPAGLSAAGRPEERLPSLFTRLGLEQRQGRIVVDAEHRSCRAGIYAAGDLARPHAQAVLAAGDGQLAAIHLHQHLTAARAGLGLRRELA